MLLFLRVTPVQSKTVSGPSLKLANESPPRLLASNPATRKPGPSVSAPPACGWGPKIASAAEPLDRRWAPTTCLCPPSQNHRAALARWSAAGRWRSNPWRRGHRKPKGRNPPETNVPDPTSAPSSRPSAPGLRSRGRRRCGDSRTPPVRGTAPGASMRVKPRWPPLASLVPIGRSPIPGPTGSPRTPAACRTPIPSTHGTAATWPRVWGAAEECRQRSCVGFRGASRNWMVRTSFCRCGSPVAGVG